MSLKLVVSEIINNSSLSEENTRLSMLLRFSVIILAKILK